MKISFNGKHFKEYHSQTQNIFRTVSHTKKSLLSFGAFLSLGVIGVSVVSPQFRQFFSVPQFALADNTAESLPNGDERCYWTEDVAKFFALQEGKQNALQTIVPCEIPPIAQSFDIKEMKTVFPDNDLSTTIRTITTGYPIEVMIPTIATFDREVAALIVGIAKKESNWGKRVPVDKSGADCFNYWGYKGTGTRGVEMGHSCFGSPEEAVTVVGNRLKHLVELRKTSNPKNMIVWKCGSSCAGHSDESVRKWIADVSLYYDRIAFSPQ